MNSEKPTIAFYTFGCKVNQYDTQQLRASFKTAGWQEVGKRNGANIYLINTCTVTANSDRKARQLVRSLARNHPESEIVVTGCYAESRPAELKKLPNVFFVVGNREKERIAELLNQKRHRVASNSISLNTTSIIEEFAEHTRAFVKIQDGCDAGCSYCIVPQVRGKPSSRPKAEIIQEVEKLAESGYKEVVLSGIRLGIYGRDKDDTRYGFLPSLIQSLAKINGIERIRLSSIEPMDIELPELLELIEHEPKLCHHLHIPLQSGDDEILMAMQRSYTSQEYLDIVKSLRARTPRIAITTDIIVSFPGETDLQFQHTVDMVERVGFSKVHIFRYSKRPGTPAIELGNQIDNTTAKCRMYELLKVTEKVAYRYRQSWVGEEIEILAEGKTNKMKGYLTGLTSHYQRAIFPAMPQLINQLVTVKIDSIEDNYLVGNITKT